VGIPAVVGARAAMTAAAATLALAADAQAAFPGRDGLIAFTRAEGSKSGQLYVIRPDGSGLRRITHRRHGAGGASWSPDGRRILFTSRPRRGGVQVFVKRLGGGVRQLTRGRDTYAYPAWSPSGKRIVAVRGHIARDGLQYESVVTMRADGSRKRSIYSGGRLSTSYPAWSPDGRSIAFVHTDIGGTGADPSVYVVPAAGGAARQVTDVGSQDQPDWSPDGRLLAYAYGSVLSPEEIRVIRPDRTGDAPVTGGPDAADSTPAWAPSGRRLAITRRGRIWTVTPDGSGMRQVTRPRMGFSDWDPSWQPR
jgi:TolB protein